MKYLYILGLEHSGTTLTDHLLSAHPKITGLGEIANFFSPERMSHYLSKWQCYDDHDICSCGQHWNNCDFWGALQSLSGAVSSKPTVEKRSLLHNAFVSSFGSESVLVDSSKSLCDLETLYSDLPHLGISESDVLVVLCAKDPRGFVASIEKKEDERFSLLKSLQTLNYWAGEHQRFLRFLESSNLRFNVITYEKLCENPVDVIAESVSYLGLEPLRELNLSHRASHIVLGNKGFTMRNRKEIRYDDSWTKKSIIKLAYVFHIRSRQLFATLSKLADSNGKN